jgi:hypothetical protein
MNRSILSYSLGAALLMFGLAACSDSTGPAGVTRAQEQADIASAAGDATGEDVELMFANGASATGAATITRAPGIHLAVTGGGWNFDAACPYHADTGRHVCPTATNGLGLSLDRSYAYFAGTTAEELFNAATTTSINFQGHLFGTVIQPSWTATVDRTRDLTVAAGSNGWGSSRIWNGSGTGSLTAVNNQGSPSRTYVLNSSTTMTDVTVAVPRSQNPWPLSGSITHVFDGTWTMEGATTVSRSVSYTATITFNGTSTVPVDVGSRQFCVNLATRQLVNVSCR